jgi:hypothetical protein
MPSPSEYGLTGLLSDMEPSFKISIEFRVSFAILLRHRGSGSLLSPCLLTENNLGAKGDCVGVRDLEFLSKRVDNGSGSSCAVDVAKLAGCDLLYSRCEPGVSEAYSSEKTLGLLCGRRASTLLLGRFRPSIASWAQWPCCVTARDVGRDFSGQAQKTACAFWEVRNQCRVSPYQR